MTRGPDAGGGPPVGRRSYRVEAHAAAPVEAVWPLLGEAERWKQWSFLTRTELERPGAPEPDGAGAIRRFSRMGIGSREQVVAWEPPHHLTYTILSGFPVRNYLADVDVAPEDGGTRITWAATFDEKIPGTGPLMEVVLRSMMGRFARDAARYAEAHPG